MTRYVTVRLTEAEARALRECAIAGVDMFADMGDGTMTSQEFSAAHRGCSKIASAILGEAQAAEERAATDDYLAVEYNDQEERSAS